MTDLDNRLRAADPYRPTDLHGAEGALLEELMTQDMVDVRVRGAQRSLRSRLAISVAAAAAVTTAIAVPVVIAGQPAEVPRAGTGHGSTVEVVAPVKYVAAAVKVAKANPRVLVTAPGWKVRSMEGFSATEGQMDFQKGLDQYREEPVYGQKMTNAKREKLHQLEADGEEVPLETLAGPDEVVGYSRSNDAPRLKVAWYPASQHADWIASRSGKGDPYRWVELWGKKTLLVSYSATDHAVVLPVQGKVFLELRGGNLGDEAAFLAFLAEQVEQVDVPTWLAAMPPEVVTVGGAAKAADRILADIPVPPGFDRDLFGKAQALDSYQFGAAVAGAAACGWIQEWERARAAGDDAAAKHAADQLATSYDWQVLRDMDAEGDYPDVVWQYAEQVSAGRTPQGYRGALGCH